MVIRFKWSFFLLALILTSAFVLRFYKLSQIPSGFYFDEVAPGLNSYTIANKFTDEFGNFAPDFFRIGQDYRHPAYIYITASFVKILGLNIFSVRAPTALFGVFTVLTIYFLANNLFEKKSIALLATMLVAISPWFINLTRSANDVVFALFFLTAADALFIFSLNSKKRIYLVGVYLLALLCWFSYAGAILLSTLHIGVFVIFAFLAKSPKYLKLSTVVLLVAFILFPNLFYFVAGKDKLTGRFNQVSIFSSPETKLVLQEQLREDGVMNQPILITRSFHNKITNYSLDLINNYSTYFSPQFLLGQVQLPSRYKIDRTFLIYLFEPLFVLIGLYFLFKHLNWRKGFVIFMLVAAPIPAAMTIEDIPNMQRAVFMIPALQIIIAYGIYNLFLVFLKLKVPKIIFVITTLTLVAAYSYSLAYFMHQLFVHQPAHHNWNRDSQWKPAAQIFQTLESKYSRIYINSPISYYYLAFYSKSFRNFILSSPDFKKSRKYESDWQLGKYHFVTKQCPLSGLNEAKPNALYINGQICTIPSWSRKLGEAKSSDGVTFLTFLDVPYSQAQIDELKKVK
jgi:4-amino-4-deoxy-L-arabinose transferase-like glycosyltransferase